jgi:hypothetical protein
VIDGLPMTERFGPAGTGTGVERAPSTTTLSTAKE